jgi:short-subunit dehydrogenase
MTTTSQPVVVITGASSGIGYAAALAFARRGWQVAALARRIDRLAQLEQAAANMPGAHGRILSLQADVRDQLAVQRSVDAAREHFGQLNALVANAGLGLRGGLSEARWDDVETVLRTNIDGVLHSVRAAVPALRQTQGQIVFVSSVSAHLTMPYAAIYGASKAFVSSLARSLRLELEADGVGVTDMLVGRTGTEFNERRLGQAGRGQAAKIIPVMSAEQVADAVVNAVERRAKQVIVRPFDRLLLAANLFVPGIIGRLALRQYQ